jgi:amicyanin
MNKRLVGGLIAVVAIIALVALMVVAMKDDNTAPAASDSAAGDSDTTNTQGGQHANVPADEGSGTGGNSETAETDKVEIKDFEFSPAVIKVKKGTTVTWTNNDSVEHTVTAVDGVGPDSELLGKGESYSFTFNEVGTFGYMCKPHPSMKGEVTVVE